jgi:hypothetical protein
MQMIPRSALILGLAGLIPFVWGALTMAAPGVADWTVTVFGPRFVGPYLQLSYGIVILSFMSGVLWGFAARADGREATIGYALSVIPALYGWIMVGGGPTSASIHLMAGFAGLLGLDWHFAQRGLAPPWWMPLRVILTGLVVLTLLPIALG